MNLGVIGYSEGNGHPFSFSAILNGYNQDKLHLNPITPINDYLQLQPSNLFGIGNLRVTHVWTQDLELSNCIAAVGRVEHVVKDFTQMLDAVDGVLILRDDQHTHYAAPFLEKGKYVFVDKPLCSNYKELDYFMPFLEKGLLMSCSGLRYLPRIMELQGSLTSKIKLSYSNSVNHWMNYGIHTLEGLDPLIGSLPCSVQYIGSDQNRMFRVMYENGSYTLINLSGANYGGIRSHLHLESGEVLSVHFNDNFNAFRNTLVAFNEQIKTGVPAIDPQRTAALLRTMLKGQDSYLDKGKIMNI
ncbi:putative dehydrogenase [Roseivirga ehrenbergii]|uniref:Gfo/Idh/MocA-like oxidoreductase N-terminal domain-containing protein n=1 Tax=Roseivirga ehrenbergii (strain DSM 102268 / JCM 13514 / KCTC 12282 / NCIMB 14502 / KMM 6017) TaxID=279360 RepID=A0A150XC07_ROSEK|nr:Gfo/Idh/MocA family oxidoreductase [Roseivirga ehrenbergii]KYG76253.1 hypothetical protein MB14_03115 [Roseivirga ehrenbergii]TCL00219.1 putative dehydrogenase [Roseivirga ehrenbergii]